MQRILTRTVRSENSVYNGLLYRDVSNILKKCEVAVNVVAVSPLSLKQLLVKSRLYDGGCDKSDCTVWMNANKICQAKGTVYKIQCTRCSLFYVGETEQPLELRYKQHHSDMKHVDSEKPWSTHMLTAHAVQAVLTPIELLCKNANLQKRKIKEPQLIEKLRPDVNITKEMSDAMRFIKGL